MLKNFGVALAALVQAEAASLVGTLSMNPIDGFAGSHDNEGKFNANADEADQFVTIASYIVEADGTSREFTYQTVASETSQYDFIDFNITANLSQALVGFIPLAVALCPPEFIPDMLNGRVDNFVACAALEAGDREMNDTQRINCNRTMSTLYTAQKRDYVRIINQIKLFDLLPSAEETAGMAEMKLQMGFSGDPVAFNKLMKTDRAKRDSATSLLLEVIRTQFSDAAAASAEKSWMKWDGPFGEFCTASFAFDDATSKCAGSDKFRRRLLAESWDGTAEATITGDPDMLSVYAAAASSPAFAEAAQTTMGADFPMASFGASVQASEGSQAEIFVPRKYEPSDAVKSGHKSIRLMGSNDFVTDPQDPTFMPYIYGVASGASIFVLLAVYSIACFPCCYCCCCQGCCCKAKSKATRKIDLNTILAVICIITALITMIVGMSAAAQLDATLVSFGDAVNGVFDIIDGATSNLATLSTYNTQMTTLLMEAPADGRADSAKLGGCSMYAPFGAIFAIQVPDLGDMTSSIPDVKPMIDQARSLMATGVQVTFLFLFGFSTLFCVVTLLLKFGICDGSKGGGCRKCGLNLLATLSILLLLAFFLLGALTNVLSVLFADICITDPLKMVMELAPVPPPGGYMLTCEGDAGKDLSDVYAMIAQLKAAGRSIGSLEVMATASGDATCMNLQVNCPDADPLNKAECFADGDITKQYMATGFKFVIASIVGVLDSIKCSKFNNVLTTLLYDTLCLNFQGAMTSLYIGMLLGALTMIVSMFNYVKVSRQFKASDKQVAPEHDAFENKKAKDAAPVPEAIPLQPVEAAAENTAAENKISAVPSLPPI